VAPELEPGAVLTTAALERLDRLDEQCLGQLLSTFGGTPSRWVRPTGFADAAWSHRLAEQSPGAEPGAAAVLVLQGGRDGAVLPAWTGQLVGDLRSGGTKVELVVDDDADHDSILDAGRHRAVRFVVGGPTETS
jgi:alpha-beta hydrolase superfamily lysophospholipase